MGENPAVEKKFRAWNRIAIGFRMEPEGYGPKAHKEAELGRS